MRKFFGYLLIMNLFIVCSCAVPRGGEGNPPKEGQAIYLRNCAECHRLFRPRERKPEEWKSILRRHRLRVSLTTREWELLELYLTGASSRKSR